MAIAKQGWAKFFVFDDKAPLQQLKFFANPQYKENVKVFGESSSSSSETDDEDDSETTSEDEFGEIEVPSYD